tara:strand:+ start:6241 stop:6972 length:732 start_codon:yes stop_codon:yes gene_type:complete
MEKTLVVSNYNWDLEWLKMTYDYGFSPQNTVIYDKSDVDKDLSHLGEVIKSPNVGANQFDILRFIIENYENLPDISIFIKGNLFSRGENYYTTEEKFVKALNSTELFSIWVDKNVLVGDLRHTDYTPLETLNKGRLIQPVAWCNYEHNSDLENRHFCNHHEVLDWCFVDPPKTNTIEFIPASNFAVPKEAILKYSKDVYEKMVSCLFYEPDSRYDPTCAEAHMIERMFYLIWSEDLVEKITNV